MSSSSPNKNDLQPDVMTLVSPIKNEKPKSNIRLAKWIVGNSFSLIQNRKDEDIFVNKCTSYEKGHIISPKVPILDVNAQLKELRSGNNKKEPPDFEISFKERKTIRFK